MCLPAHGEGWKVSCRNLIQQLLLESRDEARGGWSWRLVERQVWCCWGCNWCWAVNLLKRSQDERGRSDSAFLAPAQHTITHWRRGKVPARRPPAAPSAAVGAQKSFKMFHSSTAASLAPNSTSWLPLSLFESQLRGTYYVLFTLNCLQHAQSGASSD